MNGVLDSETWTPEIRLNHQNLYHLIKDTILNVEVYAKFIEDSGITYNDYILDYTQGENT